jgi:putative endonuclease
MWYVYIIRSINFPDQEYVGATADLKRRLPEHNAGKSTHTAKFKPWELVWYCAFPDKYKALEFERYLKSHSGRRICEEASLTPNVLIATAYSASAALSRSRSATISFFMADSSDSEHAEAARMDCGTARAFSRSA